MKTNCADVVVAAAAAVVVAAAAAAAAVVVVLTLQPFVGFGLLCWLIPGLLCLRRDMSSPSLLIYFIMILQLVGDKTCVNGI